MSLGREVEVEYDLELFRSAALSAGLFAYRGASVRGWNGEIVAGAEKCDLVISNPAHRFDIGLIVDPVSKTTRMVADVHGGHVQNDLSTRILPRYIELLLSKDGHFAVKKGATKVVAKKTYLTVTAS